ncbi:hypothetical protein LC608_30790 [Nostoc sp. XA010]|uniref:hypothetical protein n=1 Tax=Nostoc sp. XA010 TaxID=2780407 RepID=UPI001E5A3DB9|nr:hypothetical protein [Nostoc sp. XA010]MCC5661268.1 hypothetical protein [Nostoc sp. XA010]
MEKQTERLKVLEMVQQAIKQRMNPDSVTAYVVVAREYGQKYGIESLVNNWIIEGRTVFLTPESARSWTESLP